METEGNGALELLEDMGFENPSELLIAFWLAGYKLTPLEDDDWADEETRKKVIDILS